MTDAERFMQRYMEVWPRFDADRLDEAIDPEATVHHSGMARPIRGAEESAYVRAIKELMSDTAFAEVAARLVTVRAKGRRVEVGQAPASGMEPRMSVRLEWGEKPTEVGRFRAAGRSRVGDPAVRFASRVRHAPLHSSISLLGPCSRGGWARTPLPS